MRNEPAPPESRFVKGGFSVVELLVAFLIIAAVSLTSLAAFRNMRLKQALAASTETMVEVLKRAHVFARESRGDRAWGVIYNDDKTYFLVSGSPERWDKAGEFTLEEPAKFDSKWSQIWFAQGTGAAVGVEASVIIMITVPTNVSSEIVVGVNGVVEAR